MMKLGAVHKLTLLDYPGKVSCIIFTPGCNLRCGYCHNRNFVVPGRIERIADGFIPFDVFLNFLDTRRGFLDAVVISGGEPTLQPDLFDRIRDIRERGYLVKIDTTGTRPDVLEELVAQGLVDFIAMDLKSVPERYCEFTPVPSDIRKVLESSIALMRASGLQYEFRSTILPKHHDLDVLREMGSMIRGSRRWVLQNFRTPHVLVKEYMQCKSFNPLELEEFRRELLPLVGEIEIHANG